MGSLPPETWNPMIEPAPRGVIILQATGLAGGRGWVRHTDGGSMDRSIQLEECSWASPSDETGARFEHGAAAVA
jgi:hypothetical protein